VPSIQLIIHVPDAVIRAKLKFFDSRLAVGDQVKLSNRLVADYRVCLESDLMQPAIYLRRLFRCELNCRLNLSQGSLLQEVQFLIQDTKMEGYAHRRTDPYQKQVLGHPTR